jgi:hypothetical protein
MIIEMRTYTQRGGLVLHLRQLTMGRDWMARMHEPTAT